ncbi:type IV secretory system conjugative DNA transfer family protein [Tenacibaculum agarivorans]|uniref:type IV secretory system conjugative DNA transfer family protein n=1 Tax=Tenacibaculum agarivorans TaxID=1908389 RepID=UPI00094B7CFF|nr:type IV secretory system conjugative DNA transfer family protein [Tenacibaculum agarivorans]
MGFLIDLIFGYKGKNDSVFDNARHMNAREEREIFTTKNIGFSVDGTARYLRKEVGYRGIVLCGVVGSGKSQLVITFLLLVKPEASIFLLDPSKEIRQRTEPYFKQHYNIKILDWDNPIENGSLQFNPLVWVKENMHRGGVDDFVELLIVCNRTEGTGKGDFWELSSKTPLKLLLLSLIHDGGQELDMNLENLERILGWFDVQQQRLNAYVQKWLPVQYHEQYESFIGGTEPKVRKSIIATCKSYLSMMSSETMRYITNKDTLNLGSIRKGEKPTIVYVHISENRMAKMKFLLSVLNSQLYSYLMEMPKPTDRDCIVVLEEFSSYHIDSFDKIAVTARKRRITTILVLQDLNQIHAVYGKHGDTILSNMVSKIIFGGCGLKTSKYVEEYAGLTTVEHEGRMIERPLLSALSVRQLPSNQAVLLSGSMPIKILKMRYWYEQRALKRIAGK